MERKTSITTIEMSDYFVAVQPEAPAILMNGESLTYGELDVRAERLAAALQRCGVKAGERVAVLAHNRMESVVLLYATMKIGAIYVPLNWRLAPPEFKYILEDSGARVLFSESEPFRQVIDGLDGLPNLQTRVLMDGATSDNWTGWKEFMRDDEGQFKPYPPTPQAVVYQMYTSGTTGFPKGVLITQQQLANMIVHGMLMPHSIPEDGCHLTVAPLFHAAALVSVVSVFAAGRCISILREFNPQDFVRTLVDQRITDTTVVPAMLQAILAQVPDLEQHDFSRLRRIAYGASPITAQLLRRAMDVFGCDFHQAFGMTEIVAAATALTAADHRRALREKPELLRSCGRPGPFVRVKIVDPETRHELPVGEVGEIAIEAPQLMEGYAGLPDKTAEVIDGSWYYSGDGGYVDEEGYVYIKDRIKDMVVSGGENVYPAEVENALSSHPGIADVAVIGLPDEKYGSAVVAIVVATERDAPPKGEALIDHCRDLIAGYKIPRRYEFVEDLPRNASGKLLKTELRARYS
jgi:acyl-CoA synthetase (AMP-forming)/AMP-acid ligase II